MKEMLKMNNNEKIKPQEERRRTVKYGYNDDVPNEFSNDVLRCGSVYGALSGAERNIFKENRKSNRTELF